MGRREDSWPRGAPTPASSRHGCGGENGEYALTKARSTRLRGGGGGGDHGVALGELGNALSRWRARTTTMMCGRQWRMAELSTLRVVGGEEMRNGTGECVGQARGWLQDTAVTPGGARRVASATAGRQ